MQELYLVLNAAEKRVQFLLADVERILYAEEYYPQKNGTDDMFVAIERACKKTGFSVRDISHVASVAGPGNFMGIRIGAVIASGIVRSLRMHKTCLQAPLDYMQCLAASIGGKSGEVVRVLTTGTRNSVHMADFVFDPYGLPVAMAPTVLIPTPSSNTSSNLSLESELSIPKLPSSAWANCEYPHYVLGSALSAHRQCYEEYYEGKSCLLSERFDNPSMEALYGMVKIAHWQEEDIAPIYLKECDAIQNLNHIAQKQGQVPEDAHKELQRLMQENIV